MRKKIIAGTTVRVVRSHHNMNDHCVGHIGVVERIVMKGKIFRIKMEDGFWLFGTRDLKVISTYDMLDWTPNMPEIKEYQCVTL